MKRGALLLSQQKIVATICYHKHMKHLVISVSAESSIELLGEYADVILLDQPQIPDITESYETLYIRSHFSKPELQPQKFRRQIDTLVSQALRINKNIKFIDEMSTVDSIVAFEDKWQQYQTFSTFMPRTQLLSASATFAKPIFKKRISSRGNGVTWDISEVVGSKDEWIMQESLDIVEELRVYVICGNVYPVGAIRQSMSMTQKTQVASFRELTQDEIEFASMLWQFTPHLDMIGLDMIRTAEGILRLLEVNRSPGFGAFAELANVNLATLLYEKDI